MVRPKIKSCIRHTPEVHSPCRNIKAHKGLTIGAPSGFILGPLQVHLRCIWDHFVAKLAFHIGCQALKTYSLAQLDTLNTKLWTFGVGWLHEFILILSSTLSCFCKEIWTLGIGCLHDFYTCAQLLSHRQEVNLKTFNIPFYIYLKCKDFPVLCKE